MISKTITWKDSDTKMFNSESKPKKNQIASSLIAYGVSRTQTQKRLLKKYRKFSTKKM